jgi:hypothetical protein
MAVGILVYSSVPLQANDFQNYFSLSHWQAFVKDFLLLHYTYRQDNPSFVKPFQLKLMDIIYE